MRLSAPPISNSKYFNLFCFRFLRSKLRRKLLAFALIATFIILPTPELAFTHLPQLASIGFKYTADGIYYAVRPLAALFSFKPIRPRQDTLADRNNRIAHIKVSPLKYVGYQGETVIFTAFATDAQEQIIQGAKFGWESSNPEKVSIDSTGRAILLYPGLAWVTCRAGAAEVTVSLLVRPGRRPEQTDEEFRQDQRGVSFTGSTTVGSNGTNTKPIINAPSRSRLLKVNDTAHGAKGDLSSSPLIGGQLGKLQKSSYTAPVKLTSVGLTSSKAESEPTLVPQSGGEAYRGNDFLYDELWSEPRNLVGSPINRITDASRIGPVLPESSNYNMAIPILSLAGRGLGVNLTMYYNSRVWTRHGSAITFDPVHGWPSPGFSLGFGRLVTYGPSNAKKFVLIDPDGTRRYLGTAPSGQLVTLTAKDGSNIIFNGTSGGGSALYPNGTTAYLTLVNNRIAVTQIKDRNGNYINISYPDVTCEPGCSENCVCPIYWPPFSIQSITDSLGRVIQFNYDADQKLISITAPGLGGTVQNPVNETVAHFDYESRTISNSFNGLTVENHQSPINVIKHVYFPATQTGVLFTYSSFGMAYNVSLRRQMSISGTIISDGVESASVNFNYPQSGTLTDAPAFTQRTETPGGAFSYSTVDDSLSQTRTVIVTLPDTTQQQPTASELRLTRSTNTSSAANGLLVQSEVKRGSASYAKSVLTYANDANGIARVQSVIAYDDAGEGVKTGYDYDQYGNVTNKREYGYQVGGQWPVVRRTKLTYKTDSAYINAFLRSLVRQLEVMDALGNTNDSDDVVVARSSTTYDDYGAMGGMDNYQGQTLPPGYDSLFDSSHTVRGNPTSITEWSDTAGNISTTRLMKYDIFGNVSKAQVSCCQEKSYTYGPNTYWSTPEEETAGTLTGVHLTSSAVYDFNTGVMSSRKDPNNVTTSYGYDAALRNTTITLPSGAAPTLNYSDATLSSTSYVQYQENGVNKTITTSSKRDGWGQTIEQVNKHGGQVNTTYDAMGRAISQTNPFAQGSQPGSTTNYEFDSLGRVTKVTLPGGNTIQTSHSGASVTVTDQVGRKIKREIDGLGRLVKVTEQDSSGTLTQETVYTYNTLDEVVQVNQGGQTRSFKYDALGRLLYERIPEQSAAINDGTGQMWSCKYAYTDFDAVATKTDARGVVTTFNYDTLHRLTGISYNTSNAPGVATTPSVTYTYDTSGTSGTKGLLLSVDVGTEYRESYSYGAFKRVSAISKRIGPQSGGQTYTINFQYNEISQPNQIGHMYPEYDNKGRLFAVRDSVGGTAHFYNASYSIAGQATSNSLRGTLINESYAYDSQRLQMTGQTATRGTTTLLSLTYNYQAQAGQNGSGSTAGNSSQLMSISGSIEGQAESASYAYDLVGRLTTCNQTTNGVSAQRRFDYDRWGNRTGVWNATSGGTQIQSIILQQSGGVTTNRITSVTNNGSSSNYTYDATGNVTNDGQHAYQYDAENRLVGVDGGIWAYDYDHQNRRVKKAWSGGSTHYVWLGAKVMSEHNGQTGTEIVRYYYAGSRMIAKIEGGVIRYFINDRLSTRLVLDVNGNIVGRQAHLPFGEQMGASGANDKHKFTSYEEDSETGTDYAVNRQYSQNVGRFNRPDPMTSSANKEMPQSWNRYSYTANDPVNLIDPLGLFLGSPDIPDPCDLPKGVAVIWDGIYFNTSLLCPGELEPVLAQDPSGRPPLETCNVVLSSDENLVAMYAAAMGESTEAEIFSSRHTRQYQDGDAYGRPTGNAITQDVLYSESALIASVIVNRARRDNRSFKQIVEAPNQFEGYAGGIREVALARASLEGTPLCDKLRRVKEAVETIVNLGVSHNGIFSFRAVRQDPPNSPPFIRRQGNAIRVGHTDFF